MREKFTSTQRKEVIYAVVWGRSSPLHTEEKDHMHYYKREVHLYTQRKEVIYAVVWERCSPLYTGKEFICTSVWEKSTSHRERGRMYYCERISPLHTEKRSYAAEWEKSLPLQKEKRSYAVLWVRSSHRHTEKEVICTSVRESHLYITKIGHMRYCEWEGHIITQRKRLYALVWEKVTSTLWVKSSLIHTGKEVICINVRNKSLFTNIERCHTFTQGNRSYALVWKKFTSTRKVWFSDLLFHCWSIHQ